MLYIRTQSGAQYHVNEKAEIIRLDMPGFQPSGQWLMRGLRHVKKTSLRIPFNEITRERLKEMDPTLYATGQFLYKNGKPQWTVDDYDHGTLRTWGDGVKIIQFI
jgi:hypothetical protein